MPPKLTWTDGAVAYLLQNFNKYSIPELAKQFNISTYQVKIKAKELGLVEEVKIKTVHVARGETIKIASHIDTDRAISMYAIFHCP